MKIDLGNMVRKRIIIFPAFKKLPRKEPAAWALFPAFTVGENQVRENLQYNYPVILRSTSSAELEAMLNHAITAAQTPIEVGNYNLWLHATSISPIMRVGGSESWEIRLTYIFRASRVTPIAPVDVPSGSIVEIPVESHDENKSTKEVK